MRILKIIFLLVTFSASVHAVQLDYYLSKANEYNTSIPTPESILGYQVGDWHARPEQIERYFRQLADVSPRVKIEYYARSHEQRPLFLAYISSEENIAKLETIRQNHLKREKNTNRPAVTWMGYSVHGNEASGSNASLLLAYHLTAASDKTTLEQLNDQIIIIDPMINPDGLGRFASWVNSYKSKSPNADPQTAEHNENWPRSRTNHYWFDLNRDWLLLQHPESQGRVKMFHQWKPNVLTDFHEMGTNSTYFFQPGVPARQNPLTPQSNFELTKKIGQYHAKALDNIGSLYYTKENFDDFYYGKGSTYPDINGSIGILFEQASARGHLQESDNGELSFPFAIRNHLTTSLSTIKAVQQNRKALLTYQRNFYRKAQLNAKTKRVRAYVYTSEDTYRLGEFHKILNGHQIRYYPLNQPIEINGKQYTPANAYIVPLQQEQAALVEALFEQRTQFKDNTFYDVSSWTLPLAFDFSFAAIDRSDFNQSLLSKKKLEPSTIFETIDDGTVALAFRWRNFDTVRLLSKFHQNNLKTRLVTKPVEMKTPTGSLRLSRGDILLPLGAQPIDRVSLQNKLQEWLKNSTAHPVVITSGLSLIGPDIGSPSVANVEPLSALLVIGDGVNSYQAGEVWHLFDQRLDYPLSMISMSQFSKADLEKYTHLIMVDGRYKTSDSFVNKVDTWLKAGGTLIAQSKASDWVINQGWLSASKADVKGDVDTKVSYADKDDAAAENYIGGAIFKSVIDITHPLAYGLSDNNLPIFKRSTFAMTEPKEAFVAVARFAKQPLLAGYASKLNQQKLAGSTSVLVQKKGKGKIIAFSDDMNFRAYWLGTSRVFVNALYLSDAIDAVAKTEDKAIRK